MIKTYFRNVRKNYESITKVRLFPTYCYYCFMNSSEKRIGTQSSMGPVGFVPFYKVGPTTF